MKFKEFLKESESKFIIPDKLRNGMKIGNDIKNTDSWKVKVILGNNDSSKKGKYDEVGYIAVSPTSNTIIPIARADEHQAGYELLHHLIKNKMIPDEPYVTLYKHSNYIYGQQDKKYMEDNINAYKKWLELGGKNLKLSGTNGISYSGSIQDFIERVKDIKTDGKVVFEADSIFETGQNLIKELIDLTLKYKKIVDSGSSINHSLENQKKNFIKQVSKFIKDLGDIYGPYPQHLLSPTFRTKLKEEIVKAEADDDWKTAGELVFGHDGIKNIIHMSLKATAKGHKNSPKSGPARNAWYDLTYYHDGFGDVKLAVKEFDKMGQI